MVELLAMLKWTCPTNLPLYSAGFFPMKTLISFALWCKIQVLVAGQITDVSTSVVKSQMSKSSSHVWNQISAEDSWLLQFHSKIN